MQQRPLSEHWADIAAFKLVKEQGCDPQVPITVASGITPSGTVHVGNFREVITADLVVRSLIAMGYKVRFIYSWDNFDSFRRVPKNIPQKSDDSLAVGDQDWSQYLGMPISSVPDPWGDSPSLAQGRMNCFEEELQSLSISPEMISQRDRYESGGYAHLIQKALQNTHIIRHILNSHRSTPLAEDWLPLVCYCKTCEKKMDQLKYDGQWQVSGYCTACDVRYAYDIREGRYVKLSWRVDWPMRWVYEKTQFEPGGKDHSSKGGAYDTSCEISRKVFDYPPVAYLPYDFVMIRGVTGKMSSSSGDLYTLSQLLEVYEPVMIRWLFAAQKPNHDFAISLQEDVIKVYEEFDQLEKMVFVDPPQTGKNKKRFPLLRRIYELSCLNPEGIAEYCPKPAFRKLCDRLQICDGSILRTQKRFYAETLSSSVAQRMFTQRAKRALCWLHKYAPSQFTYVVNRDVYEMDLSVLQQNALCALSELAQNYEFADLLPEKIHELLYDRVITPFGGSPKDIFPMVYYKLISRPQGPRLSYFLRELGSQRVIPLLR